MRPEHYLRPILHRWWVIVLAALVASGVGYASQIGKPKTYEAQTRLAVSTIPTDYFFDQLAANYTQALEPFIHNPNAVQSAVDKRYLPAADAATAYGVVTRASRDNRTVAIALSDTDPARAARVVGALARVAVEKNAADRQQTADDDRRISTAVGQQNAQRTPVVVVTSLDCAAPSVGLTSVAVLPDCPAAPATANGPRTKLTALAAALVGAVLGLVVVLALGALDDSLTGRDDVQRYLRLPVVATIPPGSVRKRTDDPRGSR